MVVGAYPYIAITISIDGIETTGGDVGTVSHHHLSDGLHLPGREVNLPHAITADNVCGVGIGQGDGVQSVSTEYLSPLMGLRVKFETEFLVNKLIETFAQGIGDNKRRDGC